MSFKTVLLLIFSIFSPYISQIFSTFSPLFSPTVKYMNPIFPLHLPLMLLLLSPIFNCFSSFLTYSTLLFVLEFHISFVFSELFNTVRLLSLFGNCPSFYFLIALFFVKSTSQPSSSFLSRAVRAYSKYNPFWTWKIHIRGGGGINLPQRV